MLRLRPWLFYSRFGVRLIDRFGLATFSILRRPTGQVGNPSSAQRLKNFKGGECTKFEELEPHERAAKHPREGQRPERPIPPARARLPFSQPQWPTRAGCQRLFTAPTTNSCVHVGQELVLEITCVSASILLSHEVTKHIAPYLW